MFNIKKLNLNTNADYTLNNKIYYMNHPIENLSECVYDYLVLNQDAPKSFEEIYNDITKESGHRCLELLEDVENNRFKLLTVMYTLEHSYMNIQQIFGHGTVYLIFTTNDKNPEPQFVESIVKCNNENDLLLYILQLNNKLVTEIYPGSLLEYCVKSCDLDTLNTIFIQYPMHNSDDYIPLLDLAFRCENSLMTKKIIELKSLAESAKYEFEITKLVALNKCCLESEQSQKKLIEQLQNDKILLFNKIKVLDNDKLKLNDKLKSTMIFRNFGFISIVCTICYWMYCIL
jgi:hypothetical protein